MTHLLGNFPLPQAKYLWHILYNFGKFLKLMLVRKGIRGVAYDGHISEAISGIDVLLYLTVNTCTFHNINQFSRFSLSSGHIGECQLHFPSDIYIDIYIKLYVCVYLLLSCLSGPVYVICLFTFCFCHVTRLTLTHYRPSSSSTLYACGVQRSLYTSTDPIQV